MSHLLSYPMSYIYEQRWELLLRVFNWPPYAYYTVGTINPVICPEAYEDDISLAEWIRKVSKKTLRIIKLLLESNISYEEKLFILNRKDDKGMTLLHHAVKNGFEEAVKYLVESGADIHVKDANGSSPLTALRKYDYFDTLSMTNAWYRCYTTSDGMFGSCNTTSYDEIARYLIWSERENLLKCDARSAALLEMIIEKQMLLSLYELLKAGVDMNCQEDKSKARPFLRNLRLQQQLMNEVFKMFGVDISFTCKRSFVFSELHLIFHFPPSDNIGNLFEPSLNKRPSPLQRFINKHPDGVSILNTCYDDQGYLPIHHAADGGNFTAIKWLKRIGVKVGTRDGKYALMISIVYLGELNTAELLESSQSIQYSTSNNRKEVFKELLESFFSNFPQFLCTPSVERLFPLQTAELIGPAVLNYVYKKASQLFQRLPLNCAKEQRIDNHYRIHFQSLKIIGLGDA